MALQNLANLAEIVAVLGLIASLIYVGRQVRQNTVQMKVGASSDRLGMFTSMWLRIADDREYAKLVYNGDSGYSSLDDIDKMRLQALHISGLSMWSHLFDLHQQTLLSDDAWKEQLMDIETLGRRQDVRDAWNMNKARFSAPFQEFLADYLE